MNAHHFRVFRRAALSLGLLLVLLATVLRAGAAFEDAQPWADRRPSEELMVDS